VYFNPYDVGRCLGVGESAVRMALRKMSPKQVLKLTNAAVNSIDIRKLHTTGENFLTEFCLPNPDVHLMNTRIPPKNPKCPTPIAPGKESQYPLCMLL